MANDSEREGMRIVLLRSAEVAGVMRDRGWSGAAPADEARRLIARGWATAAEKTRGGKNGGGKRG